MGLGGYNDDMLGGRYSDDSIGAERVGLLPVKTMEDTDRDDWMQFLVKLTKQGEQIMQQSDLLTSFPIPAQMDISVLKGVPGTKVCKHSVDKGQVCKVFIELYGKYTVGTKTEPTNTFPLWKKWGANSDNKPEALRKALTPTEGGAQWSCQRVTGDSKKMQSSYECTLLDYGPNGLGFVGFKGSTRLIPTGGNGKKTCVRWSRTKEMVAPTRVICCPKFDTKCPKTSECGDESYDRKKAAALYEARKIACDHKFPCARYKTEKSSRTKCEKSSGIVKSQTVKSLIADGHKRNPGESEKAKHDRSECVEKHTDCLTLVNWSKDVVNTEIGKQRKTKKDLSPSVTASRIVQKRFCQSMWRNSKQETNYTGSAEVIGSFIPAQLATLEYNYTAETTGGQSWTEATLSGKTRALPPGVLDRPLSSSKAFWPEPKWGFITPTRHRYCTGPCAEWFPQPYGCQTTARVTKCDEKETVKNGSNKGKKSVCAFRKPGGVRKKYALAVGDAVCPFAKSRANNFHIDRLKDWASRCTPGQADIHGKQQFSKKYHKICKFSWYLGNFNTCGTKQIPRGNLQRNGQATAGQFGFGTATSFRRGFSDGKHPRPSEESLGEANSEQSSTTVGISHGGDSSSRGKDLGSSQHTGSAGVNALSDKGVELEGLAKSDMEEIKRVKAVSQSHQNYARQLTKLEHLGLKLGKAEEHLHHLEVHALKRGLKIGRSKKTQFSICTVNTTTTVGKSKLGESNHVGWGRRRRRWFVNPMIAIRKAAAHARRIAAAAKARIAAHARRVAAAAREVGRKAVEHAQKVERKAKEVAKKVERKVKEHAKKAVNRVKNVAQRALNAAKALVNSLKRQIKRAIAKAIELAKKAANMVKSMLAKAKKWIIDQFKKIINKVKGIKIQVILNGEKFVMDFLHPKLLILGILNSQFAAESQAVLDQQAIAYVDVESLTADIKQPQCKLVAIGDGGKCHYCNKKNETQTEIPKLSTLQVDLKKHWKCILNVTADVVTLSKVVHCPRAPYGYKMSNTTFSSDACMSSKHVLE